MRYRTFCFCDRVARLAAILMTVLAALAGCAGGGGGGPAGIPPPFGSGYPTLANATSANTGPGISVAYTIAPGSNEIDGVGATVGVAPNAPDPGKITVSVSGVPVTGGTEADFSFEVDTALLSPLPNSPLTGGTLAPSCANCLTTGQVTADDGQDVTFIYLDPDAAGLTYSTLGLWSKPADLSTAAGMEIGGAFSLGVVTRGNDLPTSGTANYSGFFVGRYAISATDPSLPDDGVYAVGANASATVNFSGAGSVGFSTTNTQIRLETGGALGAAQAAPRLDLSATGMAITRTSTTNLFSGTVDSFAGGLTGTISGAFYGRPDTGTSVPPEMGGTVTVTNGSGTESMVGGFALQTP
jgi:hypothetical protein